MSAFEEFGVIPEIIQAVVDMDWLLPREIQAESIPLILGGGDVLMAAETGSGKTGAFCLPVLQIVYETLRDAGKEGAGKAKGSSAPTKVVMSTSDRDDGFAIAEDGLLCQSRDHHKWQGARANAGAVRGKHFYEVTMTDEGLCRVGWSSAMATREVGVDKQSFGFGGTGKKSFSKQFDSYGEAFGLNDVIGCYLDLDNKTISYSKNGKDLGVAFEIPSHLHNVPLFPSCTVKNAELTFNFGSESFAFPPSGGFQALGKQPQNCVAGVSGTGKAVAPAGTRGRSPLAIILEPSRELAEQTYNQVSLFKKHLPSPGIQEVLLIGGMAAKDQIKQLERGADIVVGTPGRVEDFVKTGKLDLSQVRFYVLDEVDGLLTQGHGALLENIYGKIPKETADGKRLQLIVCSATLHSPEVKQLANKIMHFPTWVDLKGLDSVPDTVHHCIVWANPETDTWWHKPPQQVPTDGIHKKDKVQPGTNTPEMLSEAVKVLKYKYLVAAIDKYKMDQAIIFCRTKLDCDNLERFLTELGGGGGMVNEYSCTCVHGDRSRDRRSNLQAFKDGEVRFLICTDVAARGIDITGVPFVINMTLPPPDEKANYVHRIGRVGRADRMGLAISIVSSVPEKVWYHGCASRGKNCNNTKLRDKGGCAIWYDEPQCAAVIEEHLGVTIPVVDESLAIETGEVDGQVVYGQKRKQKDEVFYGHADILAPSVAELAELEHVAQLSYLGLKTKKWK